jgi:hypothetical protein
MRGIAHGGTLAGTLGGWVPWVICWDEKSLNCLSIPGKHHTTRFHCEPALVRQSNHIPLSAKITQALQIIMLLFCGISGRMYQRNRIHHYSAMTQGVLGTHQFGKPSAVAVGCNAVDYGPSEPRDFRFRRLFPGKVIGRLNLMTRTNERIPNYSREREFQGTCRANHGRYSENDNLGNRKGQLLSIQQNGNCRARRL